MDDNGGGVQLLRSVQLRTGMPKEADCDARARGSVWPVTKTSGCPARTINLFRRLTVSPLRAPRRIENEALHQTLVACQEKLRCAIPPCHEQHAHASAETHAAALGTRVQSSGCLARRSRKHVSPSGAQADRGARA